MANNFFATQNMLESSGRSVTNQKKEPLRCTCGDERPEEPISLLRSGVIRYCFGNTFFLSVMLYAFSVTAFAQRGDLDYYAPRTTGEGGTQQMYNSSLNNHLRSGRERLASGDYNAAKGEFEFVLNFFPNDPQALSGLSEVCAKWKSAVCDNAIGERFQRAIARNPGAAQSYVVQAMYFHRINKLDAAVKAYKQAIELAPDSVNAHYNLGLAYADLKQFDLANQHAQKSYAGGVTLPGLRTRLQNAGKWNPNVSLPVSDAKPVAETPLPEAATEKPN